jgi:hypothetical protein
MRRRATLLVCGCLAALAAATPVRSADGKVALVPTLGWRGGAELDVDDSRERLPPKADASARVRAHGRLRDPHRHMVRGAARETDARLLPRIPPTSASTASTWASTTSSSAPPTPLAGDGIRGFVTAAVGLTRFDPRRRGCRRRDELLGIARRRVSRPRSASASRCASRCGDTRPCRASDIAVACGAGCVAHIRRKRLVPRSPGAWAWRSGYEPAGRRIAGGAAALPPLHGRPSFLDRGVRRRSAPALRAEVRSKKQVGPLARSATSGVCSDTPAPRPGGPHHEEQRTIDPVLPAHTPAPSRPSRAPGPRMSPAPQVRGACRSR